MLLDSADPDPAVLRVLDDPASTVTEKLEACRQLIRAGNIGRAIASLSSMLETPELREQALGVLNQIPALKPMKRLAKDASPIPHVAPAYQGKGAGDSGFWVAPAASSTTVIVFIGMAMRLDVAIYFFQRILTRHKFNVIYVFDWANVYYFGGIRGLGQNLRETIASLRRKCAELGTRRLICLGQSSGGYAAVLYGARLKADGVLVFSPVVLSVMEDRTLARISAVKGKRLERRDVDLKRILSDSRVRPFTRIVFGADNKSDVASARHLSGLRNVVEHPLSGVASHGSVEVTTISGEFSKILAGFCNEVGPGRWARRTDAANRQSPGKRARRERNRGPARRRGSRPSLAKDKRRPTEGADDR